MMMIAEGALKAKKAAASQDHPGATVAPAISSKASTQHTERHIRNCISVLRGLCTDLSIGRVHRGWDLHCPRFFGVASIWPLVLGQAD